MELLHSFLWGLSAGFLSLAFAIGWEQVTLATFSIGGLVGALVVILTSSPAGSKELVADYDRVAAPPQTTVPTAPPEAALQPSRVATFDGSVGCFAQFQSIFAGWMQRRRGGKGGPEAGEGRSGPARLKQPHSQAQPLRASPLAGRCAPSGPSRAASAGDGRIAEAERRGRFLEAVRLLDEHNCDADVPEAGRIRGAATGAREALEKVVSSKAAAQERGSGWQETTAPDLHIYFSFDYHTGNAEIVGEFSLPFEPTRLWAMLREFDLAPLWNRSTTGIDLLAEFAAESRLYRCQAKPPIPFLAPFETLQERTYVDALTEYGVLVMVGRSPPLDATEWQGVGIGAPSPKVKRITSNAADVLRPVAPDRVVLTSYRSLKTPFRYLPSRLVGLAASTLLGNLSSSIRSTYDTWTGSEYEGRMVTAYYTTLRERIAQQCQASKASASKL